MMEDVIKKMMSDPVVFADMFNGFLHHGKQVIKSEDLTPIDPMEYYRNLYQIKSKPYIDQMVIMSDAKCVYVLYCIDDQSRIGNSLIIDLKLYDALWYHKIMIDAVSVGEPVEIRLQVPLVVNFDSVPWGLSTGLCGMFAPTVGDDIKQLVSEYKINIFDPHIQDGFDIFQTKLKDVFQCIKSGQIGKKFEAQLVNEGLFDLGSNSIVDGNDVKAKMAEKYEMKKTSV